MDETFAKRTTEASGSPGQRRRPTPARDPLSEPPASMDVFVIRDARHSAERAKRLFGGAFDMRLMKGEGEVGQAFASFCDFLPEAKVLARSAEEADRNLARDALETFCAKADKAAELWPHRRFVARQNLDAVRTLFVRLALEQAQRELGSATFDSNVQEGLSGVKTVFGALAAAFPYMEMFAAKEGPDRQLAADALAMFCDKAGTADRSYPLRNLVPEGALERARELLSGLGGAQSP